MPRFYIRASAGYRYALEGRLPMMAKGAIIRNSRWLHQDDPGSGLAALTAATGIASLLVVIALQRDIASIASTLVLVAAITLVVYLAQSRVTEVEIDIEAAVIKKSTKFPFFAFHKKYPLRDFDEVKLTAMDEPVQDGYRSIRYAVVLSGKTRSLELLSTERENEGQEIQKELAAFLGMTGSQSSGGAN